MTNQESAPPVKTIEGPEIGALLAHRYPFLLVDRIEIHQPGRIVVGRKLITAGEWWVNRSEGVPVTFPHSLVIEAMAQTSAGIMRDLVDGAAGAVAYFMGVTNVRMRAAARPGDELLMHLTLLQWRRGLCRAHGVATANGSLVASADLTTIVRIVA